MWYRSVESTFLFIGKTFRLICGRYFYLCIVWKWQKVMVSTWIGGCHLWSVDRHHTVYGVHGPNITYIHLLRMWILFWCWKYVLFISVVVDMVIQFTLFPIWFTSFSCSFPNTRLSLLLHVSLRWKKIQINQMIY